MLEIADREFQAIQDEDEQIRNQARIDVQAGNLEEVEITPDALKSYLDNRLGVDGRMGSYNYNFLARNLRNMGFQNFQQIEECVTGYDDDLLSCIIHETRQGQISRFEDVLLAGMGDNYSKLHQWSKYDWWQNTNNRSLKKLADAGVEIKSYNPPNHN